MLSLIATKVVFAINMAIASIAVMCIVIGVIKVITDDNRIDTSDADYSV